MNDKVRNWLDKKNTCWSKHEEYPNRKKVLTYLYICMFSIAILIWFLVPNDYKNYSILIVGTICVSLVLWFMFFHFKWVEGFPIITRVVSRKIHNNMVTMYRFDKKLFYSIDDVDAYEGIDKEESSDHLEIDFIDISEEDKLIVGNYDYKVTDALEKEDPITTNEKGEELIFGETEEEFMENMDAGMRDDIQKAVDGHPDSRFPYLQNLKIVEISVGEKPKITPELKELMPDLMEKEEFEKHLSTIGIRPKSKFDRPFIVEEEVE